MDEIRNEIPNDFKFKAYIITIDLMKVQPSTATYQKEWQELAVN